MCEKLYKGETSCMRAGIFLSLIILTSICSAQHAIVEVDLSRIPQQKVRCMLEQRIDDNRVLHSHAFQPTYRKGQSVNGYHLLESAYVLRETPENVWRTYQETSPAISWNGSMVSFGLLVSTWSNDILYSGDQHFAGIDTGQVIFVNLRILKGLYNLAVGLEIVDIDNARKTITYSYIKGGKSRGEQTLYFKSTRRGNTQIIHQTAFKGDSFLRDRCLYPYFHRIAINEFHRNMKKCVMVKNKLLAQN